MKIAAYLFTPGAGRLTPTRARPDKAETYTSPGREIELRILPDEREEFERAEGETLAGDVLDARQFGLLAQWAAANGGIKLLGVFSS